MNRRCKKLSMFFTVLVFGNSLFMGDIGTVNIFRNTLTNAPIKPEKGAKFVINNIILFTLPPIDTNLIENIDDLRGKDIQFLQSS